MQILTKSTEIIPGRRNGLVQLGWARNRGLFLPAYVSRTGSLCRLLMSSFTEAC